MLGALILRAYATALILAWAAVVSPTATAQEVGIESTGQGDAISVTAFADMQVDRRTAWDVISDYDHLAEFIPDMHSSRVTQRDGDRVIVEQTGQFAFLFFQQPVEVKLVVVEIPPRRIVARAVGGNLKEMEGRYTLEDLPDGGVRLSYTGRLTPDFPVPPVIGKLVLRNVLGRQFNAMVKEILRREALARGSNQTR